LIVNVSPGRSSNNPSEGVVGKGDEGVVDEVEGEGSVVGDITVGGVGVGVLLVEPADESVGRQLESPSGHPGAEGHEESVTEESVGHAYLIGGLGEYVVEEVSELSEDEVRNNNKSSREDQIGDNPGSLEETKEGTNNGVSTVTNIVRSSECGVLSAPEGGLYSNVDGVETGVSTSQGSDNYTGEGTEHSPEDGERGGEVVTSSGGTLEAEVDLEHTENGGDERTKIISFVDGVEVV